MTPVALPELPKYFMHVMDNTEGFPENVPNVEFTPAKKHPFGRPGRDFSKEYPVYTMRVFTENEMTAAILAERAAERARCAAIALAEKVEVAKIGNEDSESDIGYNLACDHVADAIRSQP